MKLSFFISKVIYRLYLKTGLLSSFGKKPDYSKSLGTAFEPDTFGSFLKSSFADTVPLREKVKSLKSGKLFFFEEFSVPVDKDVYIKSPLTGKKYDTSKHWSKSSFSADDGKDDIKFIWEINRLNEFDALLTSFVLNNDLEALEILKKHFHLWKNSNPYDKGINWYSNMEVAIRLIRLLYLKCVIGDMDDTEFSRELAESVLEHYAHTSENIFWTDKTMHARNHYVVELAALSLFEVLYSKERLYTGKLEKELEKLFNSEGFYIEGSTGYHIYVLSVLLAVDILIRCCGRKIPFLSERIANGLKFLSDLTMPDGSIPNYGDCDDGYVFRPVMKKFQNTEDILQAGNTLYGKTFPCARGNTNFKETGVFLHRSEKHCLCFKNSNVKYGHTHLDMLSVFLAAENGPVIFESGTFAYNCDRKIRNYHRSLLAHSTIIPENPLPIQPLSNFAWSGNLTECTFEVSDDKVSGSWHIGENKFSRIIKIFADKYLITDVHEGNGSVYSQFIVYDLDNQNNKIIIRDREGKNAILLEHDAERVEICEVDISHSYGSGSKAESVKLFFNGELNSELKIL